MEKTFPSATVIERYGEALVRMQISKEEKEAIREKAGEPILVICTKRYHDGTLGMFKLDNVYALPKIIFEARKKRKGKRYPLKACSRKEAEAQLQRNRDAAIAEQRRAYKDATGEDFPADEELDGPIGVGDEFDDDKSKKEKGKQGEKDVKSPDDRSAQSPTTK